MKLKRKARLYRKREEDGKIREGDGEGEEDFGEKNSSIDA
jgi:hypothetical protein